jgi:hypothetical protein
MPNTQIEITGKVYAFQVLEGFQMDGKVITRDDGKQVGIVCSFDPFSKTVTALIYDQETIEIIDGRDKEITVGEGAPP